MTRCSRRDVLLGLLGLSACRRQPPLPDLGLVPPFALQNQDGKGFGSSELHGRVWAAAFMFTRCPSVCPRVTRFMRKLQTSAGAEHVTLQLVSISVDPENDTPAVLKAYAQQYGAELGSWAFLTGDFEAIKRTSVEGFKLALDGRADPNQKDYGIIHGSHLVLVDGSAHIRGYYRSEDDVEAARLIVDARRLA
ncbi:MAG: SCO family protein [Polyangiaceae bacterium]